MSIGELVGGMMILIGLFGFSFIIFTLLKDKERSEKPKEHIVNIFLSDFESKTKTLDNAYYYIGYYYNGDNKIPIKEQVCFYDNIQNNEVLNVISYKKERKKIKNFPILYNFYPQTHTNHNDAINLKTTYNRKRIPILFLSKYYRILEESEAVIRTHNKKSNGVPFYEWGENQQILQTWELFVHYEQECRKNPNELLIQFLGEYLIGMNFAVNVQSHHGMNRGDLCRTWKEYRCSNNKIVSSIIFPAYHELTMMTLVLNYLKVVFPLSYNYYITNNHNQIGMKNE